MRTTGLIAHSAPFVGAEEEDAVVRVLRSGRLAQGPEVEAFEEECAARVGRKYGVAVSSGTAALHLALHALGVDENDTVVIPAYACASLLTAITMQRTTAHLCDVGADFNLVAAKLPPCSAVVLPHLFGKAAQRPDHSRVIEDLAQSIGGETGRDGVVAIASFYATKLMTTGEGGMVLTDTPDIADHVRDHRDYDNRDDFLPRFSYKMTEMQAAMGRVQLRRLPEFLAARRRIAFHYLERLCDVPLALPDARDHVFFRFVVRTNRQAELIEHLKRLGVEAKRPVHRPAHPYANDGKRAARIATSSGGVPGADHAHETAVSLPIHPRMSEEDADTVVEAVHRFFDE